VRHSPSINRFISLAPASLGHLNYTTTFLHGLGQLQPYPYFPDFLELQGRLLPHQLALVPWFFGSAGVRFLDFGLSWIELRV
jgi:hypothetical protein